MARTLTVLNPNKGKQVITKKAESTKKPKGVKTMAKKKKSAKSNPSRAHHKKAKKNPSKAHKKSHKKNPYAVTHSVRKVPKRKHNPSAKPSSPKDSPKGTLGPKWKHIESHWGRRIAYNPKKKRKHNPALDQKKIMKFVLLTLEGVTGAFGSVKLIQLYSKVPVVNQIPAKFSGAINFILGGLAAWKLKNEHLKTASIGVAAGGLYDLIAQNFGEALGIKPLGADLRVVGGDETLEVVGEYYGDDDTLFGAGIDGYNPMFGENVNMLGENVNLLGDTVRIDGEDFQVVGDYFGDEDTSFLGEFDLD